LIHTSAVNDTFCHRLEFHDKTDDTDKENPDTRPGHLLIGLNIQMALKALRHMVLANVCHFEYLLNRGNFLRVQNHAVS